MQYSTDNGVTWTDINYWSPNDTNCIGSGGYDDCMTDWANYCEAVPPAAAGTNTMFQWHQDQTVSNDYDHWGLDNVEIFCPPPAQLFTWNDGIQDFSTDSVPASPYCPLAAGIWTFTVTLTDGTDTDQDQVVVNVEDVPNIYAGLDSSVCGHWVQLNADTNNAVSQGMTWINPNALYASDSNLAMVDTIHKEDPEAWAYNPTLNDTMMFVWQEWNSVCTATDTVLIYFAADYDAIHLVSPADSVNCDNSFEDLNAQHPPFGTGFWIDDIPLTEFYDNGVLNSHVTNPDSAVVNQPGIHYFHWVVHNGACRDSSQAVPVNFIYDLAGLNDSIYLCPGDSAVISANAGYQYIWNTGNTSSSITVSPVASQNYTVTVTEQHGCVETDSIFVDIGNPPVPEFTYTINNYTVDFTNTSTNANSFLWDFDDGGSSVLENPAHTYATFGTYNVVLTAENIYCSDTSVSQIEIVLVSQNSINNNNNINLFPNPASSNLLLEINSVNSRNIQLQFINISGNCILTKKINNHRDKTLVEFDISNFSPGFYTLEIISDDAVQSKKIIIQ